MAKRQPRAKRVAPKHQARPQRVVWPPPDDPDLIWEEWTGPPSAQVNFLSRGGMVTLSFSPPAEGVGITGLRVGFPKPEAATPPVPADNSQTRSPHRRPPSKPEQADKKTRRIGAAVKAKRPRPPASTRKGS